MIPYQMITDFDSLKIEPKEDFFKKEDFYSELKEKNISDEEYQNVKKFFMLLRLKTLGDMKRIYNFQDTLILCEIFEQRASFLEKLFSFNPRKSNSASSFSGTVHRNKSKCNIVMPTNSEQIRVFEKTLIGGYSCVNTRMTFDTDIFLKGTNNEKVIFKTRDGQLKRFSSKIIKMDENNQYGFAMTKPLPYGCIKKKENVPTLEELATLFKSVTLEDKLGHLFVVDIEFADVNKKTLVFNEIYLPIFEKHKKIDPYERSCTQIMSRANIKKKLKKEDTLYALPFNSKTHASLKEKIFVPLYAEDIYFLTTRAGWKVTRIYEHYTFEQDTFKKDFVVMNKNARKTAKTKVEKDFYKLLNNSNFGNDCRNNIGNCKLELMCDGLEDILYNKNYTNIFTDPKFSEMFSLNILKKQIEVDFEEKMKKYNPHDIFYQELKENLERKRDEDLEAIDAYENKRKRTRRTFFNTKKNNSLEDQISNSMDMRKNKMTIEFNDSQSSSINQIAVKTNTSIKCTTRFMSGKLLMFAKLSLKSFIYSLAELLAFPEENETVEKICRKYEIERIYCYHILTDTESTSLNFLIISYVHSVFPKSKVRDILFDIFSSTEIRKRFDKSDKFWEQFRVNMPENQKVLGLYEVESVNDPCLVTLATNPKEYFEYFKSQAINKKHKGIKKVAVGMDYENFAKRIKPLFNFDTYVKPKADTKQVVRISVKKGDMTTYKTTKSKFSQLSDKRFYFPNAIISLPFGHQVLNEIDQYKKSKGQRIEKYFLQEKKNLLELEKAALRKCSRFDSLDNILLQPFKVVMSISICIMIKNKVF